MIIQVGDVVKIKGDRFDGRTYLVTQVLGSSWLATTHVILGMDFPKNQVFQAGNLEVVKEAA